MEIRYVGSRTTELFNIGLDIYLKLDVFINVLLKNVTSTEISITLLFEASKID